MIRKLITITLLLLTIIPCLRGQRKEMSQARSYIKSGKDLDKAEKLLMDLLKDSLNKKNPKIYLLLYQSVQKQYEAGNEKLYLKQQYDTASLFSLTKKMFKIYESLDSIDAMPDKNGKIKLEYRKKNAAELNRYRPNLFFGGTYNIHKNNYNEAFSFFDTYIDCANQPLFTYYNFWTTDKKILDAAYWATYCGFKLKDPNLALKYSDVALKDSAKQKTTLIYIAEAFSMLNDEANYLKTLNTGFRQFRNSPYFFSHLMDFFTANNKLDNALALADSALAADKDNPLFLFAKSSVLLNMERFNECILVSDSLISINDSLPEAYYNAGTAYLNKARAIEKAKDYNKKKRSTTLLLYEKALPYIEKYRKLSPDGRKKWGPALYRIYLKLNKGQQFEEIDKLLKER